MMQCFAPKTLNCRCTTDFVMMLCLYASRELHNNPITSLHSGAFSSLPLLDELYVSAMCMLGARSLDFFNARHVMLGKYGHARGEVMGSREQS